MTDNELLDFLLDGTAATLDIPELLHDRAVAEYGSIARFLADKCLAPGNIQIYPQGSFRLGTVVLPTAFGDQYDIDLVFLRAIPKDSTTQAELKRVAGELLAEYVKSQEGNPDCPKLIERGRCWTLEYASLKFHLDILPTVPDDELPPSGELLTDRDLFRWQHSNPIGYANWFRQRETETQYRSTARPSPLLHNNVGGRSRRYRSTLFERLCSGSSRSSSAIATSTSVRTSTTGRPPFSSPL